MKYKRSCLRAKHQITWDRMEMLHQGGHHGDRWLNLVGNRPLTKRALFFGLGEVELVMTSAFISRMENGDMAGIFATTVACMKICRAMNMGKCIMRQEEGQEIETQQDDGIPHGMCLLIDP